MPVLSENINAHSLLGLRQSEISNVEQFIFAIHLLIKCIIGFVHSLI